MHSAVARGWVSHRRFTPAEHAFRYRLSMLYLDLDEAPTLFRGRWLWSFDRANAASVRRRDHFDGATDLATAAREAVAATGAPYPRGRVTLLAQPRYFGYCINPISLFLLWSPDEARIEWLIAEVHNTPWGERHPYVLRAPRQQAGGFTVDFDKRLHVSPFMQMNMQYRLTLRLRSGEQLVLGIENWRDGERLFAANMNLALAPVNGPSLAGMLLGTPLMTLKVAAAIYFEALRIKLKGVPYVPHPGRARVENPGVSR